MFQRRSSRFALEVLVLVALAVSVAVAQLSPLVIGGVMLVGWVVVSLLEWASLQGEPHYGAGLPPRYYQPEVRLPTPVIVAEVVHARLRASAPEPVIEPAPAFESLPAFERAWPVQEQAVAPFEPITALSDPEPGLAWLVAPLLEPEPVVYSSRSRS
jgi:hypothetical protein